MELRDWLHKNRITISDFASQIGVSRHWISDIINKDKRPGKRLARDIVCATKGEVTEKSLRKE